MDTHDKFKTFCSNILISTDTVADISYRYKRITKQLNKDFWTSDSDTAHSFYVGSYGRDTDIHVSDIDMIFQLPYEVYKQYNEYRGNGQSALLQAVRSSLQKTYGTSYISGDGQVIKINFTDGICFEIVPAFLNKDGSYTFPDANDNGSWKTTNPKPEISEIAKANQEWSYNLKRLCRMARAWKDLWEVPMGGLLIDTLAYNFLSGCGYKDKTYSFYDWITRDFFKFLKDQNEQQSYWYAVGSNQLVWRKGKFEYKALRCYNISIEAIDYEKKEQHPSANKKWREIYGTTFPS